MAARCFPVAVPGSLLKGSTIPRDAPREKRDKPGKTRKGRALNPKHLALVRRCGCLGCDNDPARVAAHLRTTIAGKPIAGIGAKPDDRWSLPLCATCHTDGGKDAQHNIGEVTFWKRLGLDPHAICDLLVAASPDIEAMRAVVFKAREGRK